MTLVIDRRDAPPSNVVGESISITLFTTQKAAGRVFMPFLFAASRFAPKQLLKDMDALSFISFASWSLIRRIPYNGPPQRLRRLRFPHLFFDVSFNGGWDQYVDASVRILTGGMKAYWGSSAGFPGPLPGGQFKAFFRRHEVPCSHLYCAYPEATVRTVRQALALEPGLDSLAARAEMLDSAAFAREWEAFLHEAQAHL
jgi:hypothetical protein